MLLRGFPDLHITVEELVAEGGQVHDVGHQHRDYRGLPAPTQQRFQSEAIALLRIADGKVADIRGVADRLGMLTQLGILPDLG